MNSKPFHMLLVDDDDFALLGLAVKMTDLNISLQTVTDGEQAIDYLEGRGVYADRSMHPVPDLVVLDLDTRLTEGLAFLDWRKASASFASLPVVIFSGIAYKGAVETALAMGANCFVAKPLEFEGWETVVQQIWSVGMERSEAMKPEFAVGG
jgi:CheY-like chemotaxis protein